MRRQAPPNSSVTVQKKKPPRRAQISLELWNEHKDEILFSYSRAGPDLTLEETRSLLLERHGFDATIAQYKQQLLRWGVGKNFTEKDWAKIGHQVKKRKREGKESEVYLEGERIPTKKVLKELARYSQGPTVSRQERSPSPLPTKFRITTPEPDTLRQKLAVAVKPGNTSFSQFRTFYPARIPTAVPANTFRDILHIISPSIEWLYSDIRSLYVHSSREASKDMLVELHRADKSSFRQIIQHVALLLSNGIADEDTIDKLFPLLKACVQDTSFLRKLSKDRSKAVLAFAEAIFFSAVRHNDTDVVDALISGPLDLSLSVLSSGTLNYVILHGSRAALISLIEKGADVHGLEFNAHHTQTPLYTAVTVCNYEAVSTLLNATADPNVCTSFSKGDRERIRISPLQSAITGIVVETSLEVQDLSFIHNLRRISFKLLQHGALPDITKTACVMSPLVGSIMAGDWELTTSLLDCGADVNARIDPFRRGETGRTPLQAAVEANDLMVVEELLSRGADINAGPCGTEGVTALQAAKSFEMIKFLVERNADVNGRSATIGGRFCINAAIETGNPDAVRYLLDKGSTIALEIRKEDQMISPLIAAIALDSITIGDEERTEIISLILRTGINPNHIGLWLPRSGSKFPAIYYDSEYAYPRSANYSESILDRRQRVHLSPLDLAATLHDTKTIEMLLQHRDDLVLSEAIFGCEAAQQGRRDDIASVTKVVGLLLSKGATICGFEEWKRFSLSDRSDWRRRFHAGCKPEALWTGREPNNNVFLRAVALGDRDLMGILISAFRKQHGAAATKQLLNALLEYILCSNDQLLLENILSEGGDPNSLPNPPNCEVCLSIMVEGGQSHLDCLTILRKFGFGGFKIDPLRRTRDLVKPHLDCISWSPSSEELEELKKNILSCLNHCDSSPESVDVSDRHFTSNGSKIYRSDVLSICLAEVAVRSSNVMLLQFLVETCGADVNDWIQEEVFREFVTDYECFDTLPIDDKHDRDQSELEDMEMASDSEAEERKAENAEYTNEDTWQDLQQSTTASVLQLATTSKRLAVVEYLVSAGADINAEAGAGAGRTALQVAAEIGSLELVEFYISKRVDVNAFAAYDMGTTALQAAAAGGFLPIAIKLLEAGADVNAESSWDENQWPWSEIDDAPNNALEVAAFNGRLDMVQLLLDNGANGRMLRKRGDSGIQVLEGSFDYSVAIRLADICSHFAVADLLRRADDTRRGAMDPNVPSPAGEAVMEMFDEPDSPGAELETRFSVRTDALERANRDLLDTMVE
ncbi:ankyrin [Ascobolus immersus RN42]|uniref:Ankyrin n=1 Tax=Ascobolus immersus RN42 TaxID=1160509 RepID=A0A3N4I016_ASCIM|nr:ankyrin [Ascobolus immersus RN42]